ncbi:LysR family transcriptional regulator [Rhodobacteraceae bacterium B1Z28]|uniref:LysR family transcriptional regulator n=1 Tax=Ruegeria haliotis TaxID=2747601 RepID=A0ABX2PV56_9RHOB|nr:LysR substrate-binding domain-containing protein [Ruegeria haliotis]NVO58063.1 LysR family transcriptional regulator [Ruegeria haliotis]
MLKTPNLIWLRSFEYAARYMSFTAAAKELGITQTALSLHVRSLEAQLGCKLFTRAARNLSLTEVGQAYAFSIRRALGEIDLSTTSLFGANHLQEVTVRVPISTATLFLAHKLPEFTRNHPEVSVRLVSNIWAESAGHENVDVELRLGLGDWEDLPAKKISEESIVLIAAKSRSRQTLSFAELSKEPLIQILGFQDMWQRYLSNFGVQRAEGASSYSVDTTIAAVDIAAAGGGYAVVLERFAHTAIETGRSIAIVGDAVPIEQSHFLVRGQTSNAAAKRQFETWLESTFA